MEVFIVRTIVLAGPLVREGTIYRDMNEVPK